MSDNTDTARLDWLEAVHTLHGAVEILYVVDGYTLTRTHDGNPWAEFFGTDLRAVIDQAMLGDLDI